MTISIGDRLPDATLSRLGQNGPESVELAGLASGRRIAIFAVPGAYTPTCTNAHLPSFIRSIDEFKSRGIAEVICISVNDPFVLRAWGDDTGATDAGVTMLGDPEGKFTNAIGMDFSVAAAGLINRSRRYAMVVDDGVVQVLNIEDSPGECSISGAEELLKAID